MVSSMTGLNRDIRMNENNLYKCRHCGQLDDLMNSETCIDDTYCRNCALVVKKILEIWNLHKEITIKYE